MPAKFHRETKVSPVLWQISHHVLQVATEFMGKVGGNYFPAGDCTCGKPNPQVPARIEKYIWYIFEAHHGMVILHLNFTHWGSIWNE